MAIWKTVGCRCAILVVLVQCCSWPSKRPLDFAPVFHANSQHARQPVNHSHGKIVRANSQFARQSLIHGPGE